MAAVIDDDGSLMAEPDARRSLHVLLADDQPDVLTALELLMKAEGFRTRSVGSPEAVLEAVREDRFDALLVDLNYSRDTTSGEEGLELLGRLASLPGAPPAIVMTAWGSVELAVEAMRRGARDFVMKPWRNEELVAVIQRHARRPASASAKYSKDELHVAARVQSRLWPQTAPAARTLDVAGYCRPVGAVGGDTYDFIDWGEGRLAFTLADVCGKGLPAALMMASLQATLRGSAGKEARELETFVAAASRSFFDATELQHYATLFLALYDDRRRELQYVGCGHPAPILLRGEGGIERLTSTAPAFGMFEALVATSRRITLGAADTLVVFSDGVVEARRGGRPDDELGDEGLVELVRALGPPFGSASELAERIVASVVDERSYRQSDDMTVVVARGKETETFRS